MKNLRDCIRILTKHVVTPDAGQVSVASLMY